MGLQTGSVSLTRYLYQNHGRVINRSFDEAISKFRLGPLGQTDSDQEQVVGWVLPFDVRSGEDLEAELNYNEEHVPLSRGRVTSGYVMRMRIERRRVPGDFLQACVMRRFADGDCELDSVREDVRADLLKRAIPTVQHTDVFWEDSGVIHVYTSSKSTLMNFENLFQDSIVSEFGGALMPYTGILTALSQDDLQNPEVVADFYQSASAFIPVALLVSGDRTKQNGNIDPI